MFDFYQNLATTLCCNKKHTYRLLVKEQELSLHHRCKDDPSYIQSQIQ